jgi:glycosyltransferase involved in cell wall biosynthesis
VVRSRAVHILVDYRPALRQRTGVGEYVHRLTEAMAPQLRPGEQITLFSSSWKDRLRDTPPGVATADFRIPVRALNLAWHRLEWPPVEQLGLRPDVVWSLHPLLMPSRTAAQVVTIHDLYFLDRPDHTAREIRRDYARLAISHTLRADAIVTNSHYTQREAIRRLSLPDSRITVCYPGVRPPTETDASRPTAGPILHLGTVEPRKNIPTLIRAYTLLAATGQKLPELVFAGRMTSALPELEMPGVPIERIKFLGYVPDPLKQQLLAAASLLVVPSADEGFGMPALEAMAYGLPVVAANRGALPEVLGDAGLLVDADDPDALSAAIVRILEDAALRERMSRAGRERASAFTWTASAATLLNVFRNAAQHRRGRRR